MRDEFREESVQSVEIASITAVHMNRFDEP